MKTDPRVTAYIAKAPPFAQPILEEVRGRVGKACPSAEETIKWNVPFFILEDKILASMAAFKKHVKVGVWTGTMPKFVDVSELEELPPNKEFADQLRTAAGAIEGGMNSRPSKPEAAKRAKPAPKKAATKAPTKTPSKIANQTPEKARPKAAAAKKPLAKKAAKKPAAKKA